MEQPKNNFKIVSDKKARIILPNILWNANNNWLTITHVSDNASLDRATFDFYGGLEFWQYGWPVRNVFDRSCSGHLDSFSCGSLPVILDISQC